MNKANKVRLGAYILVSFILVILALITVGAKHLITQKFHAVTILNTSVEGLSIGSPVKYLGMTIGKVKRMAMLENTGNVAVYFDIVPSSIELENSKGDAGSIVEIANIAQSKRLTCFINATSIMGGTYLELSVNKNDIPMPSNFEFKPKPGVHYIPSRPSHIGNAIQNISRLLDELEKINILQLTEKLNLALDNMNEILGQSEILDIVKSMNRICITLESTVQRLQIVLSANNTEKLNRSIANIDTTVQELKHSISEVNIESTIKNFNAFLDETHQVLVTAEDAGQQLGNEAIKLRVRIEMSLTRLDNMVKQLEELSRNIANDPSQFVLGRHEKPIQEKK